MDRLCEDCRIQGTLGTVEVPDSAMKPSGYDQTLDGSLANARFEPTPATMDKGGTHRDTPLFLVGSCFSVYHMVQFQYELTKLFIFSGRLRPWPDSRVRKGVQVAQ
jgi:hypothetical protein